MKKELIVLTLVMILSVSAVFGLIVLSKNRSEIKGEDESESVSSELSAEIVKVDEKIRKPYFSGQFYPSDKKELDVELEKYLSWAKKSDSKSKLRVLVVPHASIAYSGRTAGWGFKQLEGETYSRVVLLGSSHKVNYDYAAIYDEGAWDTPLGRSQVDTDFAKNLIDNNVKIKADKDIHAQDHPLELELIYLQKVLPNVDIIPIMLGTVDSKLINILSYKIASLFDENTLLVISTDLSHYPNWQDANIIDEKTISAFLTGDKGNLETTYQELITSNFKNLETPACGYNALRIALEVAQLLKFDEGEKLDYSNSGDITGDKDRVVGYAALSIRGKNVKPILLSEDARQEALTLARNTLAYYYEKKELLPYTPRNKELDYPAGAFVTLKKQGDLRGCIGQFEPSGPLYRTIQETAISAATNDPRFPSVKAEELPLLDIEISKMTPQKIIGDWQQIRIGIDGVKIELNGKAGTLLPTVAKENSMNLKTFLETICSQKVGLDKNCYLNPEAKIYTYQTDVFDQAPTQ